MLLSFISDRAWMDSPSDKWVDDAELQPMSRCMVKDFTPVAHRTINSLYEVPKAVDHHDFKGEY